MNDRQKEFCHLYLKYFNAEKAAEECGYAPSYGNILLKKKHIMEYFRNLKDEYFEKLLIDERDVLNQYIKIAFADIKDFIEFGNSKEDGKSYVFLKHFSEVDGQIIDEVSVTNNGAKIKLCDRFKALEKLEKFFDLMGDDSYKKYIDQQKLNIKKDGNERIINVVTGISREKCEESNIEKEDNLEINVEENNEK